MVNLHHVMMLEGRSYQTSINLVDIGKVHKLIFLTLFKQIYPAGTSFLSKICRTGKSHANLFKIKHSQQYPLVNTFKCPAIHISYRTIIRN